MSEGTPADFAAVLNDAIRARGLTLDRIRGRLAEHGIKVSIATLSYWQNGRSQPTRARSLRTLAVLEEVLELEPGRLTKAAPMVPTRRRSGNGPTPDVALPRTVAEMLELARMTPYNLRRVSSHVTATIARDRTQSSEVVCNVVQCLQGGTASFPVVAQYDDEEEQEVHGLSNCTAGEVILVPEQQLVLTEMHLARPLRQGEFMMLEFMTTISAGARPTSQFGMATSKLNELVMEVQFDDGALPKRAVGYTRSVEEDLGFEAPDAMELPLSDDSVQLIRVDAPAGIYMIQWEW